MSLRITGPMATYRSQRVRVVEVHGDLVTLLLPSGVEEHGVFVGEISSVAFNVPIPVELLYRAERVSRETCHFCTNPLPPEEKKGGPRKYCSKSCKKKDWRRKNPGYNRKRLAKKRNTQYRYLVCEHPDCLNLLKVGGESRKRFCSRSCCDRAPSYSLRECKCSKEFLPRAESHIHCSKRCSRKQEVRKEKRYCKRVGCERRFTVSTELNNFHKIYCSRACCRRQIKIRKRTRQKAA